MSIYYVLWYFWWSFLNYKICHRSYIIIVLFSVTEMYHILNEGLLKCCTHCNEFTTVLDDHISVDSINQVRIKTNLTSVWPQVWNTVHQVFEQINKHLFCVILQITKFMLLKKKQKQNNVPNLIFSSLHTVLLEN